MLSPVKSASNSAADLHLIEQQFVSLELAIDWRLGSIHVADRKVIDGDARLGAL